MSDTSQPPSQGLNIIAPTEMVDLPSKGRFYKEDHPLCGKAAIEIKFITTKDEDILANKSFIKKGVVLDKLIEALIIDENIDANSLLVGDRNAILYAARRMGYGDEYTCRVPCPSCAEMIEYTFDLSEIGMYEAPEEGYVEYGVTKTENHTFMVPLPKCKATIEIRLLKGKEEKYLQDQTESKKFKNLPETPLMDTLRTITISINGIKDRGEINNFLDNMPMVDAKYLRMVNKKLSPNVDFLHQFECKECYFKGVIDIPLTTQFFWPR